ncbi:MAG TPA: AarF/ABC1/UbiB kinase family protein [Nitrospiria bacterium]|nr:AarF/ABC1/UbiB kinase family protein [Nitrospiria bacterium]
MLRASNNRPEVELRQTEGWSVSILGRLLAPFPWWDDWSWNSPGDAATGRSLARWWQLGRLAAGMARVRCRRPDRVAVRARQRVAERMGALHGLPQKIGQILSLSEIGRSDQIYTPLTESRPALSASEAFSEMEQRLGRRLTDCFRSIEGEGISASLGQVHRAILPDGRWVAVKVQYPAIRQALTTDLRALGWLTSPLGGLRRGFNLAAYQEEVGRMLTMELDYRREARMITRFAALAEGWTEIEIPKVIDGLSGDRILTMSWVKGEPIAAVRGWPLEARRQTATCLARLFLVSCFRWRLLHADPHPGNYRFLRRDGSIAVGLLDFGCVKPLDTATVDALAGLIHDVIDLTRDEAPHRQDRLFARFLELGFQEELLAPLADRLVPLCRLVFEPFLSSGPYALDRWDLGERAAEILGPYRWNFRFAGPPSLIFFMRAFQGLIQYVRALDAPVNWRDALEEAWQGGAPPPAPVRMPHHEGNASMKSERLRVRIVDAGATLVDLTFRARAAEHLPDLLPEELRSTLDQRAIDVAGIAGAAVAREFQPGDLFELEEGERRIRVWLE